MENKLTIEVISAYLPYGLKFMDTDSGQICDLVQMDTIEYTLHHPINGIYRITLNNKYSKPILRPLSDLTKEIEHNGERFVPMIKLADDFYKPRKHDMFGNVATCRNGQLWFESSSKRFLYSEGDNTECPLRIFEMYQKLFEWHFDTQNLIQEGLAIDINTLEK